MNQLVTVPQSGGYLSQLHAEHKARQARLNGRSQGAVTVLPASQANARHAFKALASAQRRRKKLQDRLAEEASRAATPERAEWRESWKLMVSLAFGCPPKASDLLKFVAKKYGVNVEDIRSPNRSVRFVRPRMEYCWLARNKTSLSFRQIGRFIGNRDHTTVLHAVRRYDAMRNQIATGEPAYSAVTRNASFIPSLVIVE
jgi:chromosomal replication initiation ATPase DnaA